MITLQFKDSVANGKKVTVTAIAVDDNNNVIKTFRASYDAIYGSYKDAVYDINAQFKSFLSSINDISNLKNELNITDIEISVIGDLNTAKVYKIRQVERDCNLYILEHYPYSRQNTFKAKYLQIIDELANNQDIYTDDQKNNMLQAKARMREALNWIDSVLLHFYDVLDQIKNATTLEELEQITWDFSQFDSTDPEVTIEEIKNLLQGFLW